MEDTSEINKKVTWRMNQNQPPLEDQNTNIFSWSSLWTVFDALGLMVVLLIQGSILNYYLIYYNEGSSGWYFWFLADFLILITFIFSTTFAWRFYQRKRREAKSPYKEVDVQRPKRFGNGFFRFTFPKQMGMLPLIYLCWIVYALVLVAKIVILVLIEIPEKLVQDKKTYSSEVIALILAGASIVFLLWVEAHRNLEDEYQKKLSKTCIDDLISHTVFEIFDAVVFLDLIIPEDQAELEADKINISYGLKMTILSLGALNFLMPTLGLYRLSRTHFGEKYAKIRVINERTGLPSTRGLDITIIYHLLRLFAVNIPYLVIRIHMASFIGKDLSVFILKNILGIWVALRSLIPEIKEWIHIRKLKKKAISDRANSKLRPSIKVDTFDPSKGWEMPALFENKGRGNDAQESFVQTPPDQARHSEEITLSTDVTDNIEEDFRNELNRY